MAAFSAPSYNWANPSSNSVLRSRWIWAAAALIITFLMLRSTIPPNIVTSYASSIVDLSKDHDNLQDVRNDTLGFERVFAISLPTRTDQHDQLTLAGSVTGINIEIVDGILGTEMEHKVVPADDPTKKFNNGAMGAWRAHMNVLQKIVRERISTAMILEGDVDWDMRVKDQLVQFAQASRILVQPAVGSNHSLDPTYPTCGPDDVATDFALDESYPLVQPATDSPYGDTDNWDLLWMGHCGTRWPKAADGLALGRVIISDDNTVPEPRWLDTMFGSKDIKTQYANHTRVVHHLKDNVCTFAYAVTQRAARALLYELGVKKVNGAMDIMVRDVCGGTRGRPKQLRCLSVQPQIFNSHVRQGIGSDISGKQSKVAKPYTRNIKFSTKINLPQIIFGWSNFTEQWGDSEPGHL